MTEDIYGSVYASPWDEPIDVEPDEFVILPAGTYPFTITGYERTHTSSKSKNPNEPMLKLELEINGGELGVARAFRYIIWTEKYRWKQSELFTAIGQRKHGDTNFRPNWQMINGASGWCKTDVRQYNGSQQMEVVRMLDPEKVHATQAVVAQEAVSYAEPANTYQAAPLPAQGTTAPVSAAQSYVPGAF
jgi:hypothetical protein